MKGATLKCFSRRAAGNIEIREREKSLRIIGAGEIDEGEVVAQPEGKFRVHHQGILAVGAEFAAGVFEEQESRGVFAGAGVGIHGSGEELDGDDVAVGRPGEGFDLVGEKFLIVCEFLAFENAFALAAGLHDPDVVALEIVFFIFKHAADGEDDAAIGGVGEGGDVFVDVDGGFV